MILQTSNIREQSSFHCGTGFSREIEKPKMQSCLLRHLRAIVRAEWAKKPSKWHAIESLQKVQKLVKLRMFGVTMTHWGGDWDCAVGLIFEAINPAVDSRGARSLPYNVPIIDILVLKCTLSVDLLGDAVLDSAQARLELDKAGPTRRIGPTFIAIIGQWEHATWTLMCML